MSPADALEEHAPPTLDLWVRAPRLDTANVELQVVHVPPSGLIEFPNRSAFEVTHLPGSPYVLSNSRNFSVNLPELQRRLGDQHGHLYAVTIHSQPRTLEFRDMNLEVSAPGLERHTRPLNLADHAALLGVWWQDRHGGWHFEYSGQTLDTLNATYQTIYLAGRYAERFADR